MRDHAFDIYTDPLVLAELFDWRPFVYGKEFGQATTAAKIQIGSRQCERDNQAPQAVNFSGAQE